jgi:UDP-N-acetylmuramate--alanine ligase
MKNNTYHMIGIGGIGMSALAHMLLQKGAVVSGSDMSSGAQTTSLAAAGAKIFLGHAAENIPPGTTVVYSTDIKKDNVEFVTAQKLGCRMLHRSEMLQELMQNSKHALCVAGTHGKTTTSSLLTWVLHVANKSPSYAIGGVIPQLKTNAGFGSGEFFVAEACESDGTFLNYSPTAAIVTNIDDDHMDFYKDFETLKNAFATFMAKVVDANLLFYCGDDFVLASLEAPGISYGFGETCQLRASLPIAKGWVQSFEIAFKSKVYRDIELNLAGRHNVLNASAVFGLALSLGVSEEAIRDAFRSFGGALRRCENKGEVDGILFLDDYAHHPTELAATLEGIRASIDTRRLIAAYQPHRYTRSQTCLGKYHGVFDAADVLVVTDIYSAREAPIAGITNEVVAKDILQSNTCPAHVVAREDLARFVADMAEPGDVVVTLGAGDVTKLSGEVQRLLTVP